MKKLLVLIIFFGCSNSSQENALLEKSMEQHEAALGVSKQVMEKITSLENQLESLAEVERLALEDTIQNLRSAWDGWESTIVEVPGHEDHHHHDHDHDHDHDHEAAPDLTPEMILEIQEDINRRINKLNERVQLVVESLEK